MNFFDVRSSVEIPDLPAETFARKLLGALHHYKIKTDKPIPVGKIVFSTFLLQFSLFKHRRLIFRGVSFGEIEYFNRGKNLIVGFKLSFMPARVLVLAVVFLMIAVSISQNHYAPLIMAAWVIILYFVIVNTTRYKFKRWFSRFEK